MKKLRVGFLLTILGLACLSSTGCIQHWNHVIKQTKSNWFGSSYHITLYANDGHIIRDWHVHSNVDNSSGGHATFYDNDNQIISVAGTYVVEQE